MTVYRTRCSPVTTLWRRCAFYGVPSSIAMSNNEVCLLHWYSDEQTGRGACPAVQVPPLYHSSRFSKPIVIFYIRWSDVTV